MKNNPFFLAMKTFLLLFALLGTSLASAATVVEFYNPDLDNYFITADPGEQSFVDGGGVGRWQRTGTTFAAGGTNQVCRFYGSSYGPNSHFYTSDAQECNGLKSIYNPNTKSWKFESYDFYINPAINRSCAAGQTPIYRAYNNGFSRGVDSNHRITSKYADIQQVVARGWSDEGIVMCAGATSVTSQTINLVGDYSYQTSADLSTVAISVEKLSNPSASRTTGTLRLELWLSSSLYSGGGIDGYRIAKYQIAGSSNGQLGPNEYFYNINTTQPIVNMPAAGSYYVTLVVSEYDPQSCQSNDNFCIVGYGNFSNLFTVAGSTASKPITLGSSSYSTSNYAQTVTMNVSEINNTSSTRTTGTLRLELWLTSSRYAGGGINGYRIAKYQIGGSSNGQLGPNEYFYNISTTQPMENMPGSGSWYVTLVVSEYDPQNCLSSDNFCIAAYTNYPNLY